MCYLQMTVGRLGALSGGHSDQGAAGIHGWEPWMANVLEIESRPLGRGVPASLLILECPWATPVGKDSLEPSSV